MIQKKINDFLEKKGEIEIRVFKDDYKKIFKIEKIGTHGNYGISERISKRNGENEKDLILKVVSLKNMEDFKEHICNFLKNCGEPRREKEFSSFINIWF